MRQSIAARNVKKSAVAEQIGMNLTSFSKRVNGRLAVDVDEVEVIADVIGVNRDWLLTGNGPMLDDEWVPPAGFEPAAFCSEGTCEFPQDDRLAVLAEVIPLRPSGNQDHRPVGLPKLPVAGDQY